jgi:uncharacterized protein (DUF58 family)
MKRSPAASDAPAGSRFIDPKALSKIANLELLARTVVEGFINGLHHSPHLGLSVDFAEHRAYQPGDDIRRVDWRLYARSDRFYVKEFESDTNTNCVFLLDISRSMSFFSQGIPKLDYARFLTACLAFFSSKQRERVGLVTFDEDVVDFVPPSAKHLDVALGTLDRVVPRKRGRLRQPLLKVTEALRRRGIVVLVSDFYEEPDEVIEAVTPLRYKGNDVIVFHVLDPAEIQFPYEENANYQDLETDEAVPVVPEYLREQYRQLIADHIAALGRGFAANRVDYAVFDTSTPLDHALFNYLSNRQRLARVR